MARHPLDRRSQMRHVVRLTVLVVLFLGTPALTSAGSGQVVTTATLSISIDVQGVGGAAPFLDVLEVTGLGLEVAERTCGGPTFIASFVSGSPATVGGEGAGEVTVIDSDVFRVDVQVPASVDGTPCEYTVDPLASLVCYEIVDIVADPAGTGQELNLAGVPTGDAVAPGEGEVIEVLGTYVDACAELRFTVEGIGGRALRAVIDSSPLDPADVSRSCDFGDVGPSPVDLGHESGLVVLDSRPTPCAVVMSVFVEGCTVTPSPDQFTMEQPVTERRFVAACAQVPPPPVVEEPSFTG
jgi:hypothetical protein